MRGGRLWPLLLVSLIARAVEAPACRNDPDGRVSCTAEGFRTLTTAVVMAQTDQRVCLASLESSGVELKRVRGELTACESRPAPVAAAADASAVEAPPVLVEPDRRRALLGLVVGLVSSALVTAAGVAPGLPGELRIGLGALGAAGATASAVIVAW